MHEILKTSTYILIGFGGIFKIFGKNEIGDLLIAIAGGLGASSYSKGVNK